MFSDRPLNIFLKLCKPIKFNCHKIESSSALFKAVRRMCYVLPLTLHHSFGTGAFCACCTVKVVLVHHFFGWRFQAFQCYNTGRTVGTQNASWGSLLFGSLGAVPITMAARCRFGHWQFFLLWWRSVLSAFVGGWDGLGVSDNFGAVFDGWASMTLGCNALRAMRTVPCFFLVESADELSHIL